MQDAILLGGTWDSAPEQWIRAKAEFTPADQLAVYTNAYRYRLYDVTAEDHPVLKAYLGEDAFHAMLALCGACAARITSISRAMHANYRHSLVTELPQDGFAQELCQLETVIEQMADIAETAPLEQRHLEG